MPSAENTPDQDDPFDLARFTRSRLKFRNIAARSAWI